jgi:ribosome-associated protein
MRDVRIRGDVIRLGQLLKLAGIADSGAEAKALLADGAVRVNGEPEERRGRQLHAGDTVSVGDAELRVTASHPDMG